MFKMFLPEAQLDKAQKNRVIWAPASTDEVLEITKCYLQHLYGFIRSTLFETIRKYYHHALPDWRDCSIEFIFSTPTTWADAERSDFKKTVLRTGFGGEPKHHVMFNLSEGEAASAFAITRSKSIDFKPDETILSIDIGGGTTDLAFVKTLSIDPPKVQLIQEVEGIDSGSMWINVDMQRIIADRLGTFPDAQRIAWENSMDPNFQLWKCSFGEQKASLPFDTTSCLKAVLSGHGTNSNNASIVISR
jgi:hypothetical protein